MEVGSEAERELCGLNGCVLIESAARIAKEDICMAGLEH